MVNEIDLKKKALRKEIRKLKKGISEEQRELYSSGIMRKIEKTKEFIKAKSIFIYWAMDDEVDTRPFIVKWYKEKKFILPSIIGNELVLKMFDGEENLKNGDLYSIPEPAGIPYDAIDDIDMAIIPGVAFDNNNNRMGRGKAYYDRILKQIKGKSFLVGICYDFQMVEKVPTEEHDIKMDEVIHL